MLPTGAKRCSRAVAIRVFAVAACVVFLGSERVDRGGVSRIKQSSLDSPAPSGVRAADASCAGAAKLPAWEAPSPKEGDSFFELIHRAAGAAAMPADLAYAVAYVESGFDAQASGDVGEVGLMQVRPQTAAMLGFRGTDRELAAPQTNIRYGVAYLAEAWRLAEGDICRALMKYRAGHGEERMTARSIEYCARAKDYLRRIGSSLGAKGAGAYLQARIEQPERSSEQGYAAPRPPRPKALRLARLSGSEGFWARHDARIRVMKERVYAKWRQMAHRHAGERIASRL
jgi:hypothetical protein